MDDPKVVARAAREGLSKALNLLQDPALPPGFMDAAEPIAKAMGALMGLERGDGAPAHVRSQAEMALVAAREALGKLQGIPSDRSEEALGTVAGSLGKIHGLSRWEGPPAPAPPPPEAPVPAVTNPGYAVPAPQAAPVHVAPPTPAIDLVRPAQPAAFGSPPGAAFAAPPAFGLPPPHHAPPPGPAAYAPPPFGPPMGGGSDPFAARAQPQPAPHYAPPPMPQFGPPPGAPPPGAPAPAPGAGQSIPPPTGTIEAELGAHSASNFYKTLSGNDIVEHGGLFVSTYAKTSLHSRVRLRVHMPGGYHFDCGAIVQWTRDTFDSPDSPPGFGAQLLDITPEQKQLITRYARNREPMFYDDL